MSVRKLDIYRYVDKGREGMAGVLHEGGKVIATNGKVLAVVGREYPASLEGKIIDKKGNEIEARFPNYRSIVGIVQDTEEAGESRNGMSQTDVVNAYKKIKGGLKILNGFTSLYIRGEFTTDIYVDSAEMDAFVEFLRVYPGARCLVSAKRNEHRFVHVGGGTPEDPEAQLIFMGQRAEGNYEHKPCFSMGNIEVCDLKRTPVLDEIETVDDVLERLGKKDEIEKRRALGTTTRADLKLLEDVRIFMSLLRCTKEHFEIIGEAA